MRVLVTGSAGFIGFHLCRRLLGEGHEVVGLDAVTPYYDVRLKEARLDQLRASPQFRELRGRIEDAGLVTEAFSGAPEIVVHLAAQAGVRYSLTNPHEYAETNVAGTLVMLEAARRQPPKHVLIASSSSVYGMSDRPCRETDNTDRPASLYAATKKATEAMSHSYAHLFGIPVTCLRFFTVYGPWGRPDMAPIRFAEAIHAGRALDIYGEGRMKRDFTYVEDVVDAVMRLVPVTPVMGQPVGPNDTLSPVGPWRVVNIAGGRPVQLMHFVSTMEAAMGREAQKTMLPMQPGDVVETAADTSLLEALVGTIPETPVEAGLKAFAEWFQGWKAASSSVG